MLVFFLKANKNWPVEEILKEKTAVPKKLLALCEIIGNGTTQGIFKYILIMVQCLYGEF